MIPAAELKQTLDHPKIGAATGITEDGQSQLAKDGVDQST